MRVDRRPQRREVLALAVAARDQHDGAVEAVERRARRGDRRALRVVDEQHAARLGDPLHPVRQALESRERGQHVAIDLGDGRRERERRQRVLRVVPADERAGPPRAASSAPPRASHVAAPRLRAALDEAPRLLRFGHAGAERLHEAAREAHRERARIVAVQHLDAAAARRCAPSPPRSRRCPRSGRDDCR